KLPQLTQHGVEEDVPARRVRLCRRPWLGPRLADVRDGTLDTVIARRRRRSAPADPQTPRNQKKPEKAQSSHRALTPSCYAGTEIPIRLGICHESYRTPPAPS